MKIFLAKGSGSYIEELGNDHDKLGDNPFLLSAVTKTGFIQHRIMNCGNISEYNTLCLFNISGDININAFVNSS